MLLPQAQEPARDHIHEAQLPAVIDVEVRHIADVARPGVKDALLAEFMVRGPGMLVPLQPDEVHGSLLSIPAYALIMFITNMAIFHASNVTSVLHSGKA
jgi:hypothetical protein